jgi:carboxymethylenebutenolidase
MPDLVPIPSPGIPVHYGERGDPLVVLVPDWYGRLPWIDPYATALAVQGYRVVVPDFYEGFCTVDDETASELREGIDTAAALATIDDIVAEAREQGSPSVGLIGFSFGGWLVLLHAQNGDADAVVAYYATLGAADHGVIPCPVLLNLAESDEWNAGASPAAFTSRLENHGTPVTEFTYLGTAHSFANASVVPTFDSRAAALAFARSTSFLDKHLATADGG